MLEWKQLKFYKIHFYYFFKLTIWIVIIVLLWEISLQCIDYWISYGYLLTSNRFHFRLFPNLCDARQSGIVSPLWSIYGEIRSHILYLFIFLCWNHSSTSFIRHTIEILRLRVDREPACDCQEEIKLRCVISWIYTYIFIWIFVTYLNNLLLVFLFFTIFFLKSRISLF